MNQTAEILGYPQPAPVDLGAEYSRSFLEHLTWFFPGNQKIVLDTYMGCYNDAVWQECRVYAGIPELIKLFKDNGYRTAILSDKREIFGVLELEQSGLVGLIDRSMFLADGMAPKPDPSRLQDLTGAFEVSPHECLFICDRNRDIECAKRGGTWSGAALWGSVEPRGSDALQPEFLWKRVGDVAETWSLGFVR